MTLLIVILAVAVAVVGLAMIASSAGQSPRRQTAGSGDVGTAAWLGGGSSSDCGSSDGGGCGDGGGGGGSD